MTEQEEQEEEEDENKRIRPRERALGQKKLGDFSNFLVFSQYLNFMLKI